MISISFFQKPKKEQTKPGKKERKRVHINEKKQKTKKNQQQPKEKKKRKREYAVQETDVFQYLQKH